MPAKLLIITLSIAILFTGCSAAQKNGTGGPLVNYDATKSGVQVGGQPAIILSSPPGAGASEEGAGGLRFVEADLLPGRGMNVFRIRAQIPGKGIVDLIEAPPLADAPALFANGAPDTKSVTGGGAILLPWANRIRGKLSRDGKTIRTKVLGHTVNLPANWSGKAPGAEKHSIHGLMLAAKMDSVAVDSNVDHAEVTADWHAGNFGGHWLSSTDLKIHAELRADQFAFTVTATNVGHEKLPIGIGWHPYFLIPSGKRAQARLFIPASERAETDNYDNVFPTGKLLPLHGTPLDVGQKGGLTLNDTFLDDCFTVLEKAADGTSYAEIVDPASKYGLRVKALTPFVNAYQAYAPKERAVVALEPQFNLPDPFDTAVWGKEWVREGNGMKILEPGESVTYSIALELFTP